MKFLLLSGWRLCGAQWSTVLGRTVLGRNVPGRVASAAVLAAGIAAAGLTGGCVVEAPATTTVANPYPPVPPAQLEAIPKPPVTGEPLMWQPGHWDWTRSGYSWAPGQYVPLAGHGNLWMPGWWQSTPSGWVWQPAHWTS